MRCSLLLEPCYGKTHLVLQALHPGCSLQKVVRCRGCEQRGPVGRVVHCPPPSHHTISIGHINAPPLPLAGSILLLHAHTYSSQAHQWQGAVSWLSNSNGESGSSCDGLPLTASHCPTPQLTGWLPWMAWGGCT